MRESLQVIDVTSRDLCKVDGHNYGLSKVGGQDRFGKIENSIGPYD